MDLNPLSTPAFNAYLNPFGTMQSSVTGLPVSMSQTMTVQPVTTSQQQQDNSLATNPSGINAANDDTEDARSKLLRERNEREQKRAQRISELIDSLRLVMHEGGWKIETKSKCHTLEQSKTYIEHLKKINKEKEREVKQAQNKLEACRVLAREKEAARGQSESGGASEPESVISSLTGDSTNIEPRHDRDPDPSSNGPNKLSNEDDDASGKIYEVASQNEQADSGCNEKDHTTSVMSEVNTSQPTREREQVMQGNTAKHAGSEIAVVALRRHKRKVANQLHMSNDASTGNIFEVNYREIFLTSNIPQMIATVTGRIVSCK